MVVCPALTRTVCSIAAQHGRRLLSARDDRLLISALSESFVAGEAEILQEKLHRLNLVLQAELEELNDQAVDIFVGVPCWRGMPHAPAARAVCGGVDRAPEVGAAGRRRQQVRVCPVCSTVSVGRIKQAWYVEMLPFTDVMNDIDKISGGASSGLDRDAREIAR